MKSLILNNYHYIKGKGGVIEHLVKFCSHLDCRFITHLTDEAHKEELKNKVPSPHSDKIKAIPHSSATVKINRIIQEKVVLIEAQAGIERITPLNSKIGLQEYENFIVDKKKSAEAHADREKTVACKYLLELHALINRIDDFTIEMCIDKAKDFLVSNEVNEPIRIETFCRNQYLDLITTIESSIDVIGPNEKFECLVSIIIENCKKKTNRGNQLNLSSSKLLQAFNIFNILGLVLVRTKYHTLALLQSLEQNDKLKVKTEQV